MTQTLSFTNPLRWPRPFQPLLHWRRRRDLNARQRWEAAVCWFRVRYLVGVRATKALQLLSQPQQCGRIALHFVPGELSKQTLTTLYIGVAPEHVGRLQQIGSDFDLRLEEAADVPLWPQTNRETRYKMVAVTRLSWWQASHLHIVAGQAFMETVTLAGEGAYLPQPVRGAAADQPWQLPRQPPVGLTTRPPSGLSDLPEAFFSAECDDPCWPLGRTTGGRRVQQAGSINLYGQRDAVAAWLVAQLAQRVADNPIRLIVLDGIGDVVPRLKRKTVVTQLLGKQLTYLDIDGPAFSTGCNPLAALPTETETALIARWQHWFSSMQMPPAGRPLLKQAREAGVSDLPTLQQWLTQQERQGNSATIQSLQLLLTRLTADPTLREWLAWSTNPLTQLPEGVLLFSCRAAENNDDDRQWGREQLLHMLYLAAVACPQTQLVLIGMPWGSLDVTMGDAPLLICNGPLLPQATTVLTACHTVGRQRLTQKFLGADALLAENFALLQQGAALVQLQGKFYETRWIRENAE